MALMIENNTLKNQLEYGTTEAVIPDGVTKIGRVIFETDFPTTSATIPYTVIQNGLTVYIRGGVLTKLYIPDSVTDINDMAFTRCKDLVTNLSIRQWDRRYGLEKLDYAINYMRQYQSGDPFFDNVKSDNNKYIKHHRWKLLQKITVNDAAVVSYLVREIWLSADDIDYLLKKLCGNVEITAMLLDCKKKNFTDEYLQKLETERFEKEVGIRERTLYDWKMIYTFARNKIEGGYILRQYKGTDTDIIIPGHIAGEPVTRIGRNCFSPGGTKDPDVRLFREKIRSVYIPDTVICVEFGAFRECKSLADITIPNSVISIEGSAFESCSELVEVTLPERLAAIPDSLFLMCESLTRVNIPNSVTYIGDRAFNSCFKLVEADIPDSVEKIGSAAFSNCYALKRVTLPKGLTEISRYLFESCIVISKIEIPESVTVIREFAFSGCFSLTEITLPEHVARIEYGAFRECHLLIKVTLPKELKRIEECAFIGCLLLREITIPANVEFIAPNAFDESSDIVISAPRGSYAIRYAKKNGIKFKELPI